MAEKDIRVLYYTDTLKKSIRAGRGSLVNVISAPLGFGKTVALRRLIKGTDRKLLRINLTGTRNEDFWEELCLATIGRVAEPAITARFIRSGVPVTVPDKKQFLRYMDDLCRREGKLLLAVDDFHRADDQRCMELLLYMAGELDGALSVVAAGRCLPLLGLSGSLHVVTKNDLTFHRSDIMNLFLVNGIELSEKDVADLYEDTGGWPLMLYAALAGYQKAGGLRAVEAAPYEAIMRRENFRSISEESRKVLAALSPAKEMTRDAAVYMVGGQNAGELLDRAEEQAGFLAFDERKGLYSMHPLYRKLCLKEFQNLATDDQKYITSRWESWKEHHNLNTDDPDIMTAFDQGSDYELKRKVEAMGIQSRRDREQLLQLLLAVRKHLKRK